MSRKGVSVQEWSSLSRASLSRGSLSMGVSVQGVSLSREFSVRRPPHSNVRVVRILLECILVHIVNIFELYWLWRNDCGDDYIIYCV